ncbi:zinc finger protein 615-like [Myxocyprinus asiaticus]|uniref:zinc finger protein 615-like n=1 Tax=Myxocyprinus asiaticus TaxID=70543 RepID=UPI002223A6B0|nr:zinc finger protein 615-like [Myxocyprinus asiaticus]XP_051555571.1 zinc finger protein 615-like [Myxocyprinus asiaticus]
MEDVGALGVFQERMKSLFGSLLEVFLSEITEVFRESLTHNMCTKHCETCTWNYSSGTNNSKRNREVTSDESPPLLGLQSSESEELEADPNQCTAPNNLSPLPVQMSLPLLTALSEQTETQLSTEDDKALYTTVMVDDPESQMSREIQKMHVKQPKEAEVCILTESITASVVFNTPGQTVLAQDLKLENTGRPVTGDQDMMLPMLKDDNEEQVIRHLVEIQACQNPVENAEAENPVGSEAELKAEQNELCESEESTLGRSLDLQEESQGSSYGCYLVKLQRVQVLQRPVSDSKRFHVCSYCNKIFMFKKTLRRHKRFHTGKRPHCCSLCPKAFVFRKTLRKHEKAHFRRPYSCSQCDKRFKHRKKLRIHWRFHDGESPFVCSRCGKRYKTLKSLDRHLEYVDHGNQPFSQEN